MAKKQWSGFFSNRPNAVTYTSAVSASLPKTMQFDKNKKKLPTPYGLFCEWAKNNLTETGPLRLLQGPVLLWLSRANPTVH